MLWSRPPALVPRPGPGEGDGAIQNECPSCWCFCQLMSCIFLVDSDAPRLGWFYSASSHGQPGNPGCQCPEAQLSTVGDPVSPSWSLGEKGYSAHPSEVPRQDAATDAHSSRPNSSLLCWLFLKEIEDAKTLNNYLTVVAKVAGFQLGVSFSCSVLPSVPLAKTNIINILIGCIVLPTARY